MKVVAILLLALTCAPFRALAGEGDDYDLNTEIVREGIVLEEIARSHGPRVFALRVGHSTFQIYAGPWWYLEQLGLTLRNGMRVEVTGSKFYDRDGVLSLVVSRLRDLETGKSYTFRHEDLTPLWRGRGKHSPPEGRRNGGQPTGHGRSGAVSNHGPIRETPRCTHVQTDGLR